MRQLLVAASGRDGRDDHGDGAGPGTRRHRDGRAHALTQLRLLLASLKPISRSAPRQRPHGADCHGSTPAVGSLTAAVNNDALKVLVWAQPSHATSTIKYRFRRSTPPGGTCATNPRECTDLASSTLSGRHDLYIGTSYVQLTVTAQAGQACTHLVALTRGKSADTSLSEVSVSLIVNNRISSTTIDATTGTPPNSGVRIIDLANDQNSLRFKAKTGHSVFCSSAAHACVGSASLSLSAPGITWQTYGSESGSKGTLEAIMDVPVGSNAVTLRCVAEDLSTATHLVLLRRAASDDASLARSPSSRRTRHAP